MNTLTNSASAKRIAIIFPKDSESVFNNSHVTFGGATVQLYNFAREISKNHTVFALLNEYENIKINEHKNLNIEFTFNRKDNVLKKIFKFHRALKQIQAEVVIQRGLSFFTPLLAIYCRLYSKKFIFMFAHDREARGRFQQTNRINLLFPILLRFASALIVQNEYQKKSMPKRYTNKVNKIKNGYVIKSINFEKKDDILWVSRLEPWKRPEKFLELAKSLPDTQFTMVAPTVKKYEKYAEDIYSRADEIPNLVVHKFVSYNTIDLFFNRAKLFINTSEEEGFPNTFIQSCKNYTPILSLNVNPDNFISRFQVGYCCENDDSKMLEYTRKILKDENLYKQFAHSAFVYAKENHSIEQNVIMLRRLF